MMKLLFLTHIRLRLFMILFLLAGLHALATAPPRPGEIEKYQKDGSLAKRLEFGDRYQNYKVHPDLVKRMKARFEAKQEGRVFDEKGFPYKTGLPSKGTPRIFVLPIEFPDYPHTQDTARFQNFLFGNGDPANYPYESLKNYYFRSSYGQLTILGDVMPWHTASLNRADYTSSVVPAIKEALNALDGSVDFSQYDNNGDGEIDYFICYWTGPDTGWNTTFWAWCDIKGFDFRNDTYTIDGKSLGVYSWVWEKNDPQGEPDFLPRISIHETGHGLGLPDYYDYKDSVGPNGGLGNMDMMDNSYWDHNGFSKLLLDWTGAYVVGDSNVIHNITLRNADTHPDLVVIMPQQKGLLFDEYFIVQNRIRSGNDSTQTGTTPLYNEGLVIFHVDARLNAKGDDFYYDNSYTSHKLLRLMEADGDERIETGDGWADAGDFYVEGSSLSSASIPDSDSYSSLDRNGAYVTNISPGWSARSATFINAADSFFPNLKWVLDNNTTEFSTGGSSIWYGIQKSDATNSNAAQNALLADGQSSWIKANVTGQGTVTFDWKVSSQSGGDFLEFLLDGTVIQSISGEQDWSSQSFRVSKTGTGNHSLMWRYAKNASGSAGQDRGWLDNVQWTPLTPTLGEALDNPSLVWTASGNNGWYGQTAQSYYGGSAAASDIIGNNQSAWLNTKISGPGTLNFAWRTSSELNADYLILLLDGVEMDEISGGTAWIPQTRFIKGDGEHNLTWKYRKNASGSAYSDCGYVDKVEFLPTGELAEAVDNNILEFTTGPSYKWYYQNYFSFYGGDAVQSGYTPAGGKTAFMAIADSPGYVRFYWKVSSEESHDYLEFRINGSLTARISGNKDWAATNSYYVPASAIMEWSYVKDAAGTTGQDAGWVDRVIFTSALNLADALDNSSLSLKNSGDVPWAVQTQHWVQGGSALVAGPMPAPPPYTMRNSLLQTSLTGPGTLRFSWKISSGWYPLTLAIDGVKMAEIGKITDWEQVSTDLSPGTHSVVWEYRSDGDLWGGAEDKAWLDKVEFFRNISLNDALDNSSLVLTTYDQAGGWTGVEEGTAYTGDAARTGPIGHAQSSFLETTVTGPRNLSFNWKASSELNKDYLEFYIDDVFKERISGNTDWQQKDYILNAGQHKLAWQYYKNASGVSGSDCGWVDNIRLTSTPTLPEALDFSGFAWNSDGATPWVGQTFTSYYDGDAAQSGQIGNKQYSRLYTSITGPGLLSYYWKVSSHEGFAPLEFLVDGVRWGSISGETDWLNKTFILESGAHLVEWKYSRDTVFIDGADCGWVDRVQWTPGTVPYCNLNVPYQYPTIQEAINAAREGCVITVSPGVYFENITISGKNIVLTSYDPSDAETVRETIIDGGQNGPVITFGGDEYHTCRVAGLTITNGLAPKGGGILGNFSQATIEDCVITGNVAEQSGGGIIELSGTIQRNIISDNSAEVIGGGLFRCSGLIQNNFIYENRSGHSGGGIGWCHGTVRNNTIFNNTAVEKGGGAFNCSTQITNCIIAGNKAPVDPELAYNTAAPEYQPKNCCIPYWTGDGIAIRTDKPGFINEAAKNFHIRKDSPCVDNGCAIFGLSEDFDRDPREIMIYRRLPGFSHNDIGADEFTNVIPQITILSPEGDMNACARSFEILWHVSDVNYESSTSLYLVPSRTENSGPQIVSGIKSVNTRMSYTFNYESAPEGIFHIYGIMKSGFHAASESWSYGSIKISKVTLEDLLNYLTGRSVLPPSRQPFADLNGDGFVNIADVVYYLKI